MNGEHGMDIISYYDYDCYIIGPLNIAKESPRLKLNDVGKGEPLLHGHWTASFLVGCRASVRAMRILVDSWGIILTLSASCGQAYCQRSSTRQYRIITTPAIPVFFFFLLLPRQTCPMHSQKHA